MTTAPRSILALALVALIAGPFAVPVAAAAGTTRAERGEARLAKMLDGRTAGAPMNCIRDFAQEGMRIVDGVGFVFRRGDTMWVNRPANAGILDDGDLPVIEKQGGSDLCVHDHVQMRDRLSLMPGPVLMLGEFVPYRQTNRGESR